MQRDSDAKQSAKAVMVYDCHHEIAPGRNSQNKKGLKMAALQTLKGQQQRYYSAR